MNENKNKTNEEKIIYSLNVADILQVSDDTDIKFSEADLDFLEDKIGDYIDWRGAIELALNDLKDKRKKNGSNRTTKGKRK